MNKRKALAKVTVLSPLTATDTDVNPMSRSVEKLPFWGELTHSEQKILAEETRYLMVAYLQLGLTPIEIGQRLLGIKQLLSGHKGAFTAFMKQTKTFASRSGYRYMEDYERLRTFLSDSILEGMIRQGFKITDATRKRPLGIWTEAYVALKMNSEEPPKTDDPAAAARYLQKLELTHEQLKVDQRSLDAVRARAEQPSPGNPEFEDIRNSLEFVTKQTFQMMKNSLRRLRPEQRNQYFEIVLGAMATHRGMSRMPPYPAMAIPTEWKRGPGRPSSSDERLMELALPAEARSVEF